MVRTAFWGRLSLPNVRSGQAGQALAEACVVLALMVALFLAVKAGFSEQVQWHQDLVGTHTAALAVALGHQDVSTSSLTGPEQGVPRTIWDGVKTIGISLIDPLLSRVGAKIPLPGQKTAAGVAIGRSILQAGRSMGAEILADKVDEIGPQSAWRTLNRTGGRGLGRDRQSRVWSEQGQQIDMQVVDRALLGENPHLAQIMDGSMQWVQAKSMSVYGNKAWQLRGSAAAAYTHDTIDRIDGSEDLWQSATRPSRALVKRLSPMTTKVDQPWGRKAPPTDWLSKWSEVSDIEVPEKPTGVMAVLKEIVDVAGDIF